LASGEGSESRLGRAGGLVKNVSMFVASQSRKLLATHRVNVALEGGSFLVGHLDCRYVLVLMLEEACDKVKRFELYFALEFV
jgi:hypothetical protein